MTSFVRFYASHGHRIDRAEAEWIACAISENDNDRWRTWAGSYWVPIHYRVAGDGSYADFQYGDGKGLGLGHFVQDHYTDERYRALWTRRFDDGGEQDVVERRDIDDAGRFCRYGFDEIRVRTSGSSPPTVDRSWWRKLPDGGWAAEVTGSYRTGNNRSDMAIGPGATLTDRASAPGPSDLLTPTTPCFDGNPVYAVDPPQLQELIDGHAGALRIECRWRGRVVHRAAFEDDEWEGVCWAHRNADDWDNFLDREFLLFEGDTPQLAAAEVYRRDLLDWKEDSYYNPSGSRVSRGGGQT